MIKTEGYRKEWKAMKGNLILIHGGGPTAVINASLAGAIRQAKKEPNVDRILAAIGGTGGLMRGQVRDLTDITEEELALLERTPGSAIGTSRDALEEPEYRLLAEKCVELGAKYVLMNGGNGRAPPLSGCVPSVPATPKRGRLSPAGGGATCSAGCWRARTFALWASPRRWTTISP